MKTNIRKESAIAVVATILLFMSLIGVVMYKSSNASLKSDLDTERLKSESLLSEKLSINKEIHKLKGEMSSLMGKNTELDKFLNSANKTLASKESEIKALKKENLTVKSLQKQLAEIKGIKKDLEKQIAALNMNMEEMARNNRKTEELNNTIANLQSENAILDENTKLLSALVAQNFRVESLKGKKERLTVNSKATRKLMVGFDVPQNVTEDVSFKITTPEGKLLNSNDKSISYRVIEDKDSMMENDFYVSLSPSIGDFDVSKRIEMSYKPKEKLSSGIYKIDIYNRDLKLGSCQIRLK
ncbi:hypothetical protein N6H18_00660 [Reichenbachiella agarivorans]|uniref:Uncharacterized protein n=1 Tax=Reichenbachiella agarivorans TaxID=2979464 RepID=A0ABY6CPN7_9BACT|nr:hypothetical protein [Reichenbachiella agarivorans]UXP32486.1 hypothetical protein N6H18_00660 [Reichenbachiella agarivorans]